MKLVSSHSAAQRELELLFKLEGGEGDREEKEEKQEDMKEGRKTCNFYKNAGGVHWQHPRLRYNQRLRKKRESDGERKGREAWKKKEGRKKEKKNKEEEANFKDLKQFLINSR